MAAAMVTVPIVHRTMDIDMDVGTMAMTMCMDVSSVVTKAAAVWIKPFNFATPFNYSKIRTPQGIHPTVSPIVGTVKNHN